MFQIKTFDNGSDDEINAWLQQHPNIVRMQIARRLMVEYFSNRPTEVCNQWLQTTITYQTREVDLAEEASKHAPRVWRRGDHENDGLDGPNY